MAELVVNGLRVHVQTLGSGERPPVVFLHGLVMDNLSSWYFTAAPRVARHAPVILYDLRGHGKSERPDLGYDLDNLVADLAHLLDALDAPKVELVGNSFGGLLALAFAAAHTHRVVRLALVDADVGSGSFGEDMAATLLTPDEERARIVSREFKSWNGRHRAPKLTRLARSADALIYGTAIVDEMRNSKPPSEAQLARIDCPVLGIYGSESNVLSRAQRAAEQLRSCELMVVPGATHSVLWDQPDLVLQRLEDWCRAPLPT